MPHFDAKLRTRRPDRDLTLLIFDVPNLPFISAPELAPKEDLLVQAGLSGAPQQLPLKNNFEYDNHLSEDHLAAAVQLLPPMLSLC